MEIRRYWFVITHQILLIVAAALLGGGISFGLAITTTPLYLATAKIVVNPPSNPNGSTAQAETIGNDQTYTQLITTRPLLEQAIRDLHLTLTPTELNRLINVQVVRNTRLLQISATSPNPAL